MQHNVSNPAREPGGQQAGFRAAAAHARASALDGRRPLLHPGRWRSPPPAHRLPLLIQSPACLPRAPGPAGAPGLGPAHRLTGGKPLLSLRQSSDRSVGVLIALQQGEKRSVAGSLRSRPLAGSAARPEPQLDAPGQSKGDQEADGVPARGGNLCRAAAGGQRAAAAHAAACALPLCCASAAQ